MRSVGMSRLTLSIFAAIVISFSLLFVVLNRSSHAEYACETYSSGNYNGGNSGTGDSCATDTGSGTGTGSSSGSTGSSSSTNIGTTTSTSSGDSSSSSGSDDAATDTSTPVDGSKSVTLNDYKGYTNGSGQTLTLKVGDKSYFTVGSETHTVTVKEITAEYMIFTVASTPTDVKVPYGQTVSYDVDKDGVNDISLTYKAFSSADTTADASFAAILANDGSSSKPVSIQSTTPTKDAVGSTYWWILIPAVIIVAIAAILIIRKKRGSKAGNFTPTDFNS